MAWNIPPTAVASYLARMNTIFKKGPSSCHQRNNTDHSADCSTHGICDGMSSLNAAVSDLSGVNAPEKQCAYHAQ